MPRAKRKVNFFARELSLRGTTYKYRVFLPEGWSARQKWPIILFLHGAGERGSDGLRQTREGIGVALRDHATFRGIVVLPQCPRLEWWTSPQMEAMALASLAAASKEFHGDSRRTYLTGLSMGGYGVWDIAAKHPQKFAAIVPICGGIVLPAGLRKKAPRVSVIHASDTDVYSKLAAAIGKTPVWIFHGEMDDIVPPDDSRKLYAALKAAGGNVRHTEYAGVGHRSWEKAYADPELMRWLFSQSH